MNVKSNFQFESAIETSLYTITLFAPTLTVW